MNRRSLLAQSARSAILMNITKGVTLFEKNANKILFPASLTKLMTILIIFQMLRMESIQLSDRVKISSQAASMKGSNIGLKPSELVMVEDLIKGLILASANDAAVALAEYIAGTEAEFVKLMMHKTRELGLNNTNFTNSHGFHDDNHYSCALDIAKLSRELLAIKEITSYTNVYIDCIKKDTNRPLKLVNTNKLVHLYPEVDGLKTGYTPQAKYCLSTTAKKGDHRILVVVMGVTHERIRDIQVTDMLNYAFLHGCKE